MNAKMLVLPLLGLLLMGCESDFYAERHRHYYRREVIVVERPAPVVVQPAPAPGVVAPGVVAPPPGTVVAPAPAPLVVEEGATVGNVVVVPATVDSYIVVSDEYYYWHPVLLCWVHVHRGPAWRPGPEVRIYRGWGEHPMYRHR